MTSSYPSATSQATLPGHATPQMATPMKSDGTPMVANPNAQVDFIKTLPRKDVSFGAQAAMDRDRLPTIAQTELYSTHANTNTGSMTNEKQISTFDTQVAAHKPVANTEAHSHLTDTVMGMANKAKNMIFGHSAPAPAPSANVPSYSTMKTTTTVDPCDPLADSERQYALTTATQSMGVLDQTKSTTATASGAPRTTMEKTSDLMAREKNVVVNSLDKVMDVVATPLDMKTPATESTTSNRIATMSTTDKAKGWISNEKAALSNTAHSAMDKTKEFMNKEQAALSSSAHKLTDKAKDMLGSGPHAKTVTKTSIHRDLYEPHDLETMVQEQDFLEPAIHRDMHVTPHTTTSLKIDSTPASTVAAPELFGHFSVKRVPHSPTLIDQIASRDPTAIGAEPEDNMAMYMAEKYRGEHLH